MNKKNGIALIMTLMLIILLVIIVQQISYTTTIDSFIAKNSTSNLENRYALISAMNYAIVHIELDMLQEAKEKKKYDARTDKWGEKIELKIGDTEVECKVYDENAKFNLYNLIRKEKEEKKNNSNLNDWDKKKNNSGKKKKKKAKPIPPAEQFDRIFEAAQGHLTKKSSAKKVREKIIAWMKERKCRNNMPTPFQKKVPLVSIDELLMVDTITPNMLYGAPETRDLFPGLSADITIWSDGKININTASARVIYSLSKKMDEKTIKALIKYRKEGDKEGKKTFADEKDFEKFLTSVSAEAKAMYPELKEVITLRSNYFTIEAVATTGRMTKKLVAVVYRSPSKKKVYKLYCDYREE